MVATQASSSSSPGTNTASSNVHDAASRTDANAGGTPRSDKTFRETVAQARESAEQRNAAHAKASVSAKRDRPRDGRARVGGEDGVGPRSRDANGAAPLALAWEFAGVVRALAGRRGTQGAASAPADAHVRPTPPGVDEPLTHVRVGTHRAETHLHARMGEGKFAGVELRAVERSGRVEVTIIARDPDVEASLQRSLQGLRAAIANADERVPDVSIALASDGTAGKAPRDPREHGARDEQYDASVESMDEGRGRSPDASSRADADEAPSDDWNRAQSADRTWRL